MKNNKGFSLVELIVVIAIMAILAAVAVVGVSIYIPKAQKASDDQLVADINYIFKTACLDAGVELSDVTAATWDAQNWELDAVTITGDNNGTLAAKLIESFNDLYEVKNPEIKQEGYAIQYNGSKFVCEVAGSVGGSGNSNTVSLDYKGTTITISKDAMEALKNSTYADIGGEELLGEIASLTDLIVGDDFDATELLENEAYMQSFAKYLGVKNSSELTPEELADAMNARLEELDMELSDNAFVNGLVYWAAENSAKMTIDEANTLLKSPNIHNELSDDEGIMLGQASMVYGMYTGYVNSNWYHGTDDEVETDPIVIVKTVGSDPDFKEYVESPQGQADLAAYIEAMGVINESTSNSNVTIDVLNGGFANDDLANLVDQAMGKK